MSNPILKAVQHAVIGQMAETILDKLVRNGKAWKCRCGFYNKIENPTCERCKAAPGEEPKPPQAQDTQQSPTP